MTRPTFLLLAGLLVLGSCAARQPLPARSRPGKAPVRGAAAASRPSTRPVGPRYWIFRTPAGALAEVLRTGPRVIGFGEYHEKVGAAPVQSTLRRFTGQVLEHLADQASDLILELILPEGDCGSTAEKVRKKVEKTIERPESTENEGVTLLVRAKRLGILHRSVLSLACKDWKELLGGEEVDYQRLLTIITEKLLEKARQALARRVGFDAMGQLRNRVLLYGGALHNDLYPAAEYAAYSYGPSLQKLTGGRYVEVDLYVPEYIEGDEQLGKQAFYPIFKRESGKDRVVLIERGPSSFIIILQRDLKR